MQKREIGSPPSGVTQPPTNPKTTCPLLPDQKSWGVCNLLRGSKWEDITWSVSIHSNFPWILVRSQIMENVPFILCSEWNQISSVHVMRYCCMLLFHFHSLHRSQWLSMHHFYYITAHIRVKFKHNKRSLMCFGHFRLYSIFKIIPVTRETSQIFYMSNLFSQGRTADEECVEWRVLWLNPY